MVSIRSLTLSILSYQRVPSPLAAAVSVHPEVCRLAETLVGEIVKVPVVEKCDRASRPQCRFEIDAA